MKTVLDYIVWQVRTRLVDLNNTSFKNILPSGNGFDIGTTFEPDGSNKDKLVFTFGYHHMNERGYYTKWTYHKITVRPDFNGYTLLITKGDASTETLDYFYDVYRESFDVPYQQITH